MTTWTDPMLALLREGVSQGLSYSQIASTIGFGVSRNACIGKARRIGIADTKASAPRSAGRPPPIPYELRVARKAERDKLRHAAVRGRNALVDALPRYRPGQIVPNDPIGCRFIADDRPTLDRMCGQPRIIVPGFKDAAKVSSYCPAHHEICYRKVAS